MTHAAGKTWRDRPHHILIESNSTGNAAGRKSSCSGPDGVSVRRKWNGRAAWTSQHRWDSPDNHLAQKDSVENGWWSVEPTSNERPWPCRFDQPLDRCGYRIRIQTPARIRFRDRIPRPSGGPECDPIGCNASAVSSDYQMRPILQKNSRWRADTNGIITNWLDLTGCALFAEYHVASFGFHAVALKKNNIYHSVGFQNEVVRNLNNYTLFKRTLWGRLLHSTA